MSEETLTWKDLVANALRELGGQAHLSEINQKVKGHPIAFRISNATLLLPGQV